MRVDGTLDPILLVPDRLLPPVASLTLRSSLTSHDSARSSHCFQTFPKASSGFDPPLGLFLSDAEKQHAEAFVVSGLVN